MIGVAGGETLDHFTDSVDCFARLRARKDQSFQEFGLAVRDPALEGQLGVILFLWQRLRKDAVPLGQLSLRLERKANTGQAPRECRVLL